MSDDNLGRFEVRWSNKLYTLDNVKMSIVIPSEEITIEDASHSWSKPKATEEVIITIRCKQSDIKMVQL